MKDNGPQYISRESMTLLGNERLDTSLHRHITQGLTTIRVKIVKNLFKKAIADNKELWLALLVLDHRNTPTEGIKPTEPTSTTDV